MVSVLLVLSLGISGWLLSKWLAVRSRDSTVPEPACIDPEPSHRSLAVAPCTERGWRAANPGPWGQLELFEVTLDVPLDKLQVEGCDGRPRPWLLPLLTVDQVPAWLDQMQLEPARRARLAGTLTCTPDEGIATAGSGNSSVQTTRPIVSTPSTGTHCRLQPTVEEIFGLAQAERNRIYNYLAQYSENGPYFNGYHWSPTQLESWFTTAGLQPPTVTLIRSLLWQKGDQLSLSDLQSLCARLDSQERQRTLQMLNRVPTVLGRIYINPRLDLPTFSQYWGGARIPQQARLLVQSLMQRPEGGNLDLVHLLPEFARNRIYTYPRRNDPPWNCHHSSLNFYRKAPEDHYREPPVLDQVLQMIYDHVELTDMRFGDLVVFTQPDATVFHSAIYIADDLYFTKNGMADRRPWIIQRQRDILEAYPEGTRLTAFRLKPGIDPDLVQVTDPPGAPGSGTSAPSGRPAPDR